MTEISIAIRNGDNISTRAELIIAKLINENTTVSLTNKSEKCTKLISLVEVIKQRIQLTQENQNITIPSPSFKLHQYNKITFSKSNTPPSARSKSKIDANNNLQENRTDFYHPRLEIKLSLSDLNLKEKDGWYSQEIMALP